MNYSRFLNINFSIIFPSLLWVTCCLATIEALFEFGINRFLKILFVILNKIGCVCITVSVTVERSFARLENLSAAGLKVQSSLCLQEQICTIVPAVFFLFFLNDRNSYFWRNN